MDDLLTKFFEKERWEKAIEDAENKGISKAELIQLTSPETRARLYLAIKNDQYAIAPPHLALIPKDVPGEFREVTICENIDRIFLSIANNLFFELFPEMVHESCKSYKSGIGCGKVVKEVAAVCAGMKSQVIGKKYDLSKYFDSVAIKYIDKLFDDMELKLGKSKIINIVRTFYHSDLMFDADGNLVEQYKSLKQGTATSSFMADALLCHIDKEMSKLDGIKYWRYSDDILVIGENYEAGDMLLKLMLGEMGLRINPKKEEVLRKDKFFKFLGFAIRSGDITLSKTRIKKLQSEIDSRTIKKQTTPTKAINSVNNFLYKGDGRFSWSTSVLPVINVQSDIDMINEYIMDALRAVMTGKKKIGGLGYENDKANGVISRGIGKNVTSNRMKTPKEITGYLSIRCMKNAMQSNRNVYDTLVRSL